jgi:hypothetical protein
LRKFALLTSACTVLLFSALAPAQQIDLAAGYNTLLASKYNTSLQTFQPSSEKGGGYPSVSADVILKDRWGFNIETSWRTKQASYSYGYEKYRPILSDVNALYRMPVNKKIDVDLMAGIGIASNRFNLLASCAIPGCINYTNSNHFMDDLGVGVRYYVKRKLFIRPELHYYHIQNNFEFNSDNLIRVGASIGYTFHHD